MDLKTFREKVDKCPQGIAVHEGNWEAVYKYVGLSPTGQATVPQTIDTLVSKGNHAYW